MRALQGARSAEFEGAGRSKREKMWVSAVASKCGDIDVDDEGMADDGGNEADIYLEPIVDQARAQKEEELVQYRKEVERKARLAGAGGDKKKSSSGGKKSSSKSSSKSKSSKP